MNAATWFEDVPVIGAMEWEEAAVRLRAAGEEEAAAALDAAEQKGVSYGRRRRWPWEPKPWQHTAHAYGYLAPDAEPGEDGLLPLSFPGRHIADASLRNSRIKITLDRLRVADYPGRGVHRILFDFYAQNQLAGDDVEHLHFNATFRAQEGERAAVVGLPLFVGLNVGGEGVTFKCFTVNVRNEDDAAFLDFLESDAFKAGLKLAVTAQPAVALLSETALALTRNLLGRRENVPVQEFYMGLDFTGLHTRAALAEGSYVAVQIPERVVTIWEWADWGFNPDNGLLVSRADRGQLIPYNYVVFSVSRYGDR